MDAIAEKLNEKLYQWEPHISEIVRSHIKEIIELADNDAFDVSRSRNVEQEVLDIIDEHET